MKKIFIRFFSLLLLCGVAGSLGASALKEEAGRKAKVTLIKKVVTAGAISEILSGKPKGEILCFWDCDETLVKPVKQRYPLLYSSEMYREYAKYWNRVGMVLAGGSEGYEHLWSNDAFAGACERALQKIPADYVLVDEDLPGIFETFKELDHVVCTGLTPLADKVGAVHQALGYNFADLYTDNTDKAYRHFGEQIAPGGTRYCPGWLCVDRKARDDFKKTKFKHILAFWKARNEDRFDDFKVLLTDIVFIDNNLDTLQRVQQSFGKHRLQPGQTLNVTLVQSTKAATDLETEFNEEDRATRMVEDYKGLKEELGKSEFLEP